MRLDGNGIKCDCGQHEGIGQLGPGDRAARFARHREMTPHLLDPAQREYLANWEKQHGPVRYVMQDSHKADGTWLPKGTQVFVPRIVSYEERYRPLAAGAPFKRPGGSWHDAA